MPTTYRYFALLALVALFGFYYGLDIYGLANNNEGLYAEIAREMYLSHQHIIPTLNGLPYIEKPPLLYWLINMCFHFWGVGIFAARFVPATCGAITCLSLVFFAQQINRLREGLYAALILSTSLGFILIARIVFFDMLLTALLSLSLIFFYLAWLHTKPKYMRLAYCFLGLAVLAKGFIALVLALLITTIFLFCTKTFRSHLKLFLDPIGILIFLLVILPWHILAIIQHPGFLQTFLINEQLLRFFDKRIPHDYYQGPLYYYLPRLVLYMLPWGLLLPLLGLKKYRENTLKDPLNIFLWLWFLIPLAFFSISKTKANYYMVISCPALALLLAQAIYKDFLQKKWLKTWTIIGSIFVAISFSSIVFATHLAKQHEDFFSAKNLAYFFQAQTEKKPIFLYQEFERVSSLAFYLAEPLKIIDSNSKDLWYGSHFARKSWFPTTENFATYAQTHPYYVVLRKERLKEFRKKMHDGKFYAKALVGEWLVLTNTSPRTVQHSP